MRLFTPYAYLKNVYDLDFSKLKRDNINAILCDLDNTLVGHNVKKPDQRVFDFIEKCKQENIKLIIFSNNTTNRVALFCEELGLKHYANAKKPLKFNYRKIIKENNLDKKRLVAIGDQLLTDVLGANLMRIKAIIVDPLQQKDLIWTKINRSLENIVYRRLDKKNILKRGNYFHG